MSEPVAGWQVAASRFVIRVPDCAVIDVRDGREMWVRLQGSDAARDARAYLLGSAIGALLLQRGRLPLHASAVTLAGGAVAFLGASGAGKSTLALAMVERGAALLADDVSAVDGDLNLWPGLTRLKLWRRSLEHVAVDPGGLSPVLDRLDKFVLPARRLAEDRPHPLCALYLLPAPDEGGSGFEPLVGAEAMKALMDHTFRGGLVPAMGRTREHLQNCVELARRLPMFRLPRRWGLESLEAEVAALQDHMRRVRSV